jgi:hypothetical protein
VVPWQRTYVLLNFPIEETELRILKFMRHSMKKIQCLDQETGPKKGILNKQKPTKGEFAIHFSLEAL